MTKRRRMFVRDWPELLSEVSDLEAPAEVTPYVMARINAALAHPSASSKRSGGLRGVVNATAAWRRSADCLQRRLTRSSYQYQSDDPPVPRRPPRWSCRIH